jgi:hypothetical protein
MGGKRKSPWLSHVKKTMKSEAGKKKTMGKKWFSYVLKAAKKTYKKRGGGAEGDDEGKLGGRRRARRTQRRR